MRESLQGKGHHWKITATFPNLPASQAEVVGEGYGASARVALQRAIANVLPPRKKLTSFTMSAFRLER